MFNTTMVVWKQQSAMETWFAAVLFASFVFLWFVYYSKPKNQPPGPVGFPLIGHLHLLGDLPHQNLQKLARKYGPIMSIRLGFVPTVVISSPEYAKLILKTHDLVFASRPTLQVVDFLSYGHKGLVFAKYGSYWRNIRKLCAIELLNSSKIESFRSMRREEIIVFAESLRKAGSVIDITGKIRTLVEGMTYRMIFGLRDDKLDFKSSIMEAIELLGQFNLADYIPYIGALDIQGIARRIKAVNKVLDGFLEKIMDEHVANANGKEQDKDFVDVMLSLMKSNNTRELHLDRDHIKAVLIDMIGASMDAASTAIDWIVVELMKNPRVKKLVQQELETVVGLGRMVEETDLVKLDYLQMVVKETLRLHPITALIPPHESLEDISVNGYFIPKKSRVVINSWAIGRDPHVWSDNALEFYPERFIGTSIDLQGQDFQLLPFGSGRRSCPGMQLGTILMQTVVAQLFHCFNLELPVGTLPDDLHMNEKFGLTVARASNLFVIPTYRLCS